MQNHPVLDADLSVDLARGLRSIRLEPAQVVGSLAIHPLVLVGNPGAPYLLLHEALASKALEVTETERGTVNVLVARNAGDQPILILEGESVAGAKQNRLITVDILLAPGAEVTVNVGCVEQGRWEKPDKPFVAAAMLVEPEMRRHTHVGKSRAGVPDQMRLWHAVSRKLGRSGTESESRDYHAVTDRFKERVAEVASVLARAEGQVGLLATENGRLVGLDLLDHPRNWNAVSERLSHSYVLGSLQEADEVDGQPPRTAAEWLASILAARTLPVPTQGLGTRFTLDDTALVGGGLWHEGRVAHLAAFGFARPAEAGGWVAST